MKLYAIRDWNDLYENNRSRTVKELGWVAIPNHHDGENYSAIITHPDGSVIFSAWVLIIQVASRCHPRGTLLRDNKTPHTSVTLSLKTRAPIEWFERALEFLEYHTDWLVVQEVASDCQRPDIVLPVYRRLGDEEGKGIEQNGIEGKGKNFSEVVASPRQIKFHSDARVLVHYLNQKTGSQFRESDASLTPIAARLSEPGVELEGCKTMIDRMCARWKGTEQAEYLRPTTLFAKEKFDSYYAAKDQPLPVNGKRHAEPDHSQGWVMPEV
jgi:uncharacterized phage protein (TIGR02220 family)